MTDLSRRLPLAAAFLIIALATLVPMGDAPPRFDWGFEWSDVLVNLCLYLPLGLLLARGDVKPARIALLAVLLSGAIELLQGTVISGRGGSPADVLSNLSGALAGIAVYRAALAVRRSRSRAGLAAATVLAAFPIIFWVASGALLSPRAPATRQWWGQWAHLFGGTEPFHGSILSVRFLGHPVPDDRIDSTATLWAEAERGTLSLDVALLSGGATERLTHLASVADGEGRFVIGLNQVGDDLLLSWWSRGASLGLRPPALTLPNAIRANKGERLTIHAMVNRSRASAAVQHATGSDSAALRLTPFTGWRSLLPTRELSSQAQRLFDLVWALGLIGYILLAVRVLRSFRLN